MTGVSRVISRGSRPFRRVERWISRARTRCLVVTSARFHGSWTTRSRSTFVLFVMVTTVRSVGLITPRTLACPRNSKNGQPVAERETLFRVSYHRRFVRNDILYLFDACPLPPPPSAQSRFSCRVRFILVQARCIHADLTHSKASRSLFPGLDNWIYASRESSAWMTRVIDKVAACVKRNRTIEVRYWLG